MALYGKRGEKAVIYDYDGGEINGELRLLRNLEALREFKPNDHVYWLELSAKA